MQIQKIYSSCGVPDALERCIGAAQNIIRALADVNHLGLPHWNPMVGTLCAMACSTFGDELVRSETVGQWDPDVLGIQIDAAVLRQGLEAGIATMALFAVDSPVMSKSEQ